MNQIYGSSPPMPIYGAPLDSHEVERWLRVEDELPEFGDIVPVWDGERLYYASYWNKDGIGFWIITGHIGLYLDDVDTHKRIGDNVYPTQWMKIKPPVD
jgi:hypothetical protein